MLLPDYVNQLGYKTFFVILVLFLGACSSQQRNSLAQDGLVEAGNQRYFDQVLVQPGQAFPGFSKVYLEPTRVSFSEYWLHTHRGDYTQKDLDRLTAQYGSLLDKSLRQALEKQQVYQLVDTPEQADVTFRPHLESLNIYAPDLSYQGITRHYINEAGNATLNLLVIDAQSGVTLVQFIDHRETSSNPGMKKERTDRVTNARYFSRMMDRWSDNLLTYLHDKKPS